MEKIIGSLADVSGHTFDIRYDLFFTTERVIVVTIRHPGDTPYRYPSVLQSIFLGSAWTSHKESFVQQRIAQEKRRRLQTMTPDELVSTHSRNYEIRYSEITSAEIRRRLFQSQLRFHLSKPPTSGRATQFNLRKKQVPEARRLLKQASIPESGES